VHHPSGEYVRGDVHTNSAEGYFSILEGGMSGIYQHCGKNICVASFRNTTIAGIIA
jgi:hypothetical protein